MTKTDITIEKLTEYRQNDRLNCGTEVQTFCNELSFHIPCMKSITTTTQTNKKRLKGQKITLRTIALVGATMSVSIAFSSDQESIQECAQDYSAHTFNSGINEDGVTAKWM